MAEVWALLKVTDGFTKVHAVYEERGDLLARIERIGKANKQYRLREIRENWWRVGPEDDEDEGFFGNKPVDLRAQQVTLHGSRDGGS